VAGQTATLLAGGNVNDECHSFGPGDESLYLCRRYDFTNCGDDKTYRLGKIDLATKAFTFLTPEDPSTLALDPQPTADETKLLFGQIVSNPPSSEYSIQAMDLPSGTPAELRAEAGSPVLSPDGTRYVYADYTDKGKLWVSALDGTGAVRIAPVHGTAATWSPDGTKVAYLSDDANVSCAHIDVVNADGSSVAAPVRIRDCTKTNEFITQLAWIVRP
jgi:dipeptidyl aminopeptidase/acylaminoacyl peptidase